MAAAKIALPPELASRADVRALLPAIEIFNRAADVGLELLPMAINTRVAERAWPIFGGALGAFRSSGCANFFGLTLVWSQQLDEYLPEELRS